MMILFNHKEQVIRYVRNDVTRVLEHKQALTDERYVSDNLYAEIEALDDDVLAQLEYVAIPVDNMNYQYHYFWVQKHETRGNITSIQGVQSGIEALRKTPVRDFRPHEREAKYAIDHVLDGTNWRAGYVADTGRRSTNVYFVSVFDALKKFCSVWQLEMQFFVEVTNGRIGARYIDFKHRLGKRRGARVVYGHNALEIVKEEERTELYTALIGRGKGEEVSSEDENESGQAGYGRKINFEEVEWSVANGDPVDKPAGQLYVEIPQATERYGVRGTDGQMKPKIGFVDFQDEEDKHELIKLTYAELERLSRPQVLFKTSSVYLEGQIGDVIRVVRPDRQIDYETRIFEITWDRLMARAVDIKLGDQMNESANKRESRITSQAVDTIREEVGEAIKKEVEAVVSANGANTNYYMAEDPRDKGYVPKINDLWFRPDPDSEGDYILYRWNGEFWEEIIRTADTERVKRLVEELEKYWEEAQAEFDKIQAENDKKLNEFDSQIEEFRKRVDEFGGVSRQDILDALEEADISAQVKEAIKDAGFTKSIDDIEQRLNETAESARVTAEIVGGDGSTRYNKNRADTTNATIELEKQFVEIGSTGDDGWPVDDEGNLKELTISFEAECIPRGSSTVTVRLSTPIWYGAAIEMRPDNEFYPTADKIATGQESQLFAVYNDQYSMTVDSPWFAEKATQRVTVDSDKVVTVNPQLKTVADGNLEAEFYGEWHTEPELIFDGGVD